MTEESATATSGSDFTTESEAPVSYPKVIPYQDADADIVHYAPTGHVLPDESQRDQ